MISIQGKGVSTGVAAGPLYFYQRAKSTIHRYEVADAESEWARFKAAGYSDCVVMLLTNSDDLEGVECGLK